MDIFKLNGSEIENDLKWLLKDSSNLKNDGNANLLIGDQIFIEKGSSGYRIYIK